jgi:hypothetical protein
LDKFSDPGDEQINAPKPPIYVVVGDYPTPPPAIALKSTLRHAVGSKSSTKLAIRSPTNPTTAKMVAPAKVSGKELKRYFLKGKTI